MGKLVVGKKDLEKQHFLKNMMENSFKLIIMEKTVHPKGILIVWSGINQINMGNEEVKIMNNNDLR